MNTTQPPFKVFPFSSMSAVSYFAVADWDDSEINGSRADSRGLPLARFDVGRRHKEAEQRERAMWLCDVLNRQWLARQAIKLDEMA